MVTMGAEGGVTYMVRRLIGATVLIALAVIAWRAFAMGSSLGEKLLVFAFLGTFPTAAGFVATIWIKPKEVRKVSDKVILTLEVLLVSAGVLLLLLFIGLALGGVDGGI